MARNRYNAKLREGNQLILNLSPANQTLRQELALELKNLAAGDDIKVLEIGCGEGDLTEYILKNNSGLSLDALDASKEMLYLAENNLRQYAGRINFIVSDAAIYLKTAGRKYDIIASAWTFHNFTKKDQNEVFSKIYYALNEGGKMLLMDKFYADDPLEREKSFDAQISRYRYLDDSLRKEITAHEIKDISDNYRMDESKTISSLRDIGFKYVKILDRVERDVLLVAEK